MKFHNGPVSSIKWDTELNFHCSPTSLGFLQLPVSHSYKLGTKTVRILSVWESFHPAHHSKFLLHDSVRLLGKHLSSRGKTEMLPRAAQERRKSGAHADETDSQIKWDESSHQHRRRREKDGAGIASRLFRYFLPLHPSSISAPIPQPDTFLS